MLEAFLETSADIDGLEQVATQALANYAIHMKHWAPGYARGGLTWALGRAGGSRSAERDRRLAPLLGRYFYGKANRAGGWIPSWEQFKRMYARMEREGLPGVCADPFYQSSAPPSETV